MQILSGEQWRERQDAHHARVDTLLGPARRRRHRGETHAIEDFLFTYYAYRPTLLRRWHPGTGVGLRDAAIFSDRVDYVEHDGVVSLDIRRVTARLNPLVTWARRLLRAVSERQGRFDCFGLHEWAMLYQSETVRHPNIALRVTSDEIDATVEGHRLTCSHFDAFRFFTTPARQRNSTQLRRDDQVHDDQPGCLHANMDLYKIAYKVAPLLPAELMVDAFELAREIRVLDMRASPYDVSRYGYQPVPIETSAGRAEYARLQRQFATEAAPLRQRILAVLDIAADGGEIRQRP